MLEIVLTSSIDTHADDYAGGGLCVVAIRYASMFFSAFQ